MTDYSHSRIQTFQQCPFKYRLMYIDKIHRPTRTIEAFMGQMVHRVLHDLQKNYRTCRIASMDDLMDIYRAYWEEGLTDDIVVVKKGMTVKDYYSKGGELLLWYYHHYDPFDDLEIVGLETDERLQLPDGNRYYVRIDKLGRIDGTYYVCDYKTGWKGITQTDIANDAQLGMYALWVMRNCPNVGKVVMRWYSLATDEHFERIADANQLASLERDVVKKIAHIESCERFLTNKSGLCPYCQYQDVCPESKQL